MTNDATLDGGSPAPARFANNDRPKGIDDVELAVFEREAVLFDVQASMVHHLSAVPAASWLYCDGETTVAEMLGELAVTFELTDAADIDTLTSAVHDSLTRFAAEGLLVGQPGAARVAITPMPEVADDGTEILAAPDDP